MKRIKIKYCPRCKDIKMVRLESGEVEVFECENCKFRAEKRKNEK